MKSLEDRKKSFEEKFAKDMDLRFKVECRACKLFGLWLAKNLGKTSEEAETYAKEFVSLNLEKPGMEQVEKKARADLNEKHSSISDHIIQLKLEAFLSEAKESFMNDLSG